MAAYATAERQAQTAGPSMFDTGTAQNPGWRRENTAGLDSLLVQFADLVAERLAERLAGPPQGADEWFDTRGAAEYLGVHRDTIRRLLHAMDAAQICTDVRIILRSAGLLACQLRACTAA